MDEEGSVPGRGIAQNPVFMVIPMWRSPCATKASYECPEK